MANFLTFKNLYTNVCRLIGDDDLTKLEQVKAVINQVYLNELIQADELYPPHWASGWINLQSIAPLTITAITAATPPVVTTSAAHGFLDLELVTFWNIAGMTELNYEYNYALSDNVYLVETVAANTFKVLSVLGADVVGVGFTPYTSGGTAVHQGWKLADLANSVNDLARYEGRKLRRIGPKQLAKSPDTYWTSSYTTPQYYYPLRLFYTTGEEQTYLLFFPGASEAETMTAYTELAIDPLEADEDVPLLPPNFHPAIVAGAVTRLAESNAQAENAVIWPGIYKLNMDALVAYNRRWWMAIDQDNPGKPYGLL